MSTFVKMSLKSMLTANMFQELFDSIERLDAKNHTPLFSIVNEIQLYQSLLESCDGDPMEDDIEETIEYWRKKRL